MFISYITKLLVRRVVKLILLLLGKIYTTKLILRKVLSKEWRFNWIFCDGLFCAHQKAFFKVILIYFLSCCNSDSRQRRIKVRFTPETRKAQSSVEYGFEIDTLRHCSQELIVGEINRGYYYLSLFTDLLCELS